MLAQCDPTHYRDIRHQDITSNIALTRALRARRARPPEVAALQPDVAALQPRAQRA